MTAFRDLMAQPICFHCGEVITGPPDWIGSQAGPVALHRVCAIRAVIGGLNHLQGRCTCCGGTEPPDPPELTRYQAAQEAVAFWSRRQNHGDEARD